MLRKKLALAAAAAALVCAALAEEKKAETAEGLAAKNIAARGGLAKIKSVQSMRMIGTMRLGEEKLPTVLELKRPAKMRWEFTLEGQTGIQAYDGKTAWSIMPFAGQTEPAIMTDAETKDVEMQADLDGPLVDAAAKGSILELVGREKLDGVDSWHLRVKRKGGDARDIYLDAKTYLQFMTVSRRNVDGRIVEIRSKIGDYRDVGGLMLPHRFSASTEDVEQTQALEFQKIELNVPIDDSRFRMTQPTPPASATPSVG